MTMFKIGLIAIILSLILCFINEYFMHDLIDAMRRFKNEDDRNVIRNVFRLSTFCLYLISFMFFGFMLNNMD